MAGKVVKLVSSKIRNTSTPVRRDRLAPKLREVMILDAAITFFAEHGFAAQTRQLATQIGVSQALIFRYFGSKEALIERVYQEIFLSRWNPNWEDILMQRTKTIKERLREFYTSYVATVDDRRWIRIVMHSSLANYDMTRRYIDRHVRGLLVRIALEIRYERGNEVVSDVSQEEIEHVSILHSSIIYYLIRIHIHKTAALTDRERYIDLAIEHFLYGLSSSK